MAELPRIASSLFSGSSPPTRSERFSVFEVRSSVIRSGAAIVSVSGAVCSPLVSASPFDSRSEAAFSCCTDSGAPSAFSVCSRVLRPPFGSDAQDTDAKKIAKYTIAVSAAFRTKHSVRCIDFFTEMPPLYPKRFCRLRAANLRSLCLKAA